ncbi:YraN family protein [Haliea atlantica]|jgi:putative endonuclease
MPDGREYEERAARWLLARGWQILCRNFLCRAGELDLVALDGSCLVFVEVRARSHPGYGGAAASVDRRKQRKLQRAAAVFLRRHPHYAKLACRFDVIAWEPRQFAPDAAPRWIRNAFGSQP